jgi:hypothetical protein
MSLSKMSFYGDESGSHHDGAYILSGLLGNDEVWSQFDGDWQSALQANRSVRYLHMRECFKLEKEFHGFSCHQANRKLNDCVDVLVPFLRRGELKEFTVCLDWGIYDDAVDGPVKDLFHDPYIFLIGALTAEITNHVIVTGEGPVCFFFDDQTALIERDSVRMFNYAKATLPTVQADLLFGLYYKSDQYCYPLQAADLIAWQRHRRELNLSEDRGERPEWKRLHNAGSPRTKFFRYSMDGLVTFCRKTNSGLKAAGYL